jgi:acetyl-CoA C-acetyltransferase
MEQIQASPMAAAPYLTVMDCSGVSDGCACCIIMRTDMAVKHRKDPMYIKGLNLVAALGFSKLHSSYDFTSIHETVLCSQELYKHTGITDPSKQISLAEVHDCFTITELVLYEDLGFSERGQEWKDLLDGKFSIGGEIPVNIDGGLKSFGHPIGASGIRMIYECCLQFHGRSEKRQLDDPRLVLTHNLGGMPYQGVTGMTLVGNYIG